MTSFYNTTRMLCDFSLLFKLLFHFEKLFTKERRHSILVVLVTCTCKSPIETLGSKECLTFCVV